MSAEIVSNIDLPVMLNAADMELLDEVDAQIEKSLITGDVRQVFKFGRSLQRDRQIKGMALAKLLTSIEDHWDLYKQGGVDDEFTDVVYAEMGTPSSTVKKYTSMWRAIFDNPDVPQPIKQQLLGRPIKSLLLLTAASREGIVPWDKVLQSTTHGEVQDIVREVRGGATSSVTRITLMLQRNGILTAWRNNETVPIGHLELESSDDLTKKAIERIISSAGIMEE